MAPVPFEISVLEVPGENGPTSRFRRAVVRDPMPRRRDPRHTRSRLKKNKSARIARKRRAGRQEHRGLFLKLISYLPAAVTTLFVLAIGTLLGWIQ